MLDIGEWEPPLDQSPFDLPTGWSGGSVEIIDAETTARVWETDKYNVRVGYPADSNYILIEYYGSNTTYGLDSDPESFRIIDGSGEDKLNWKRVQEILHTVNNEYAKLPDDESL